MANYRHHGTVTWNPNATYVTRAECGWGEQDRELTFTPFSLSWSHPTATLIVASSNPVQGEGARADVHGSLTAVEAIVLWQHGTYEVLTNGSITTNPTVFNGDGRIQTQDACSAVSSNIYYYNEPGLYQTWAVAPWRGKTMLRVHSLAAETVGPLSAFSH